MAFRVFELFAKYTEAEIESKRESGELDEGIRLLKGESVKIASERSLTPSSAAVQISHALEGEEDDAAADSDAGEDYELVG